MKLILTELLLFLFLVASGNASVVPKVKKDKGEAVVVMDVQEYFMQKKISAKESEILIANINRFQVKMNNRTDIVYMQSVLRVLTVKKGGVDIDLLDGLEIDNRLELKTGNVYKKEKANAFSSGDFVDFLNNKEIETLYIVGLMKARRIYKTVCSALKRGYKVILVKDAILGSNIDSKNKILGKLKEKGADVVSLNEI